MSILSHTNDDTAKSTLTDASEPSLQNGCSEPVKAAGNVYRALFRDVLNQNTRALVRLEATICLEGKLDRHLAARPMQSSLYMQN
jgi:hypothetical protein